MCGCKKQNIAEDPLRNNIHIPMNILKIDLETEKKNEQFPYILEIFMSKKCRAIWVKIVQVKWWNSSLTMN